MGKKKKDFGENNKKTEARERKAQSKRETEERVARESEDRFWKEQGEGLLSKARAKRLEQEKQRNEASAKKQEARQLAKEEEESIKKTAGKHRERISNPKVTQHRLLVEKETEKERMEAVVKEQKKIEKKEVDEESYARMVDVENVNREEDLIDASNIDSAIVALQDQLTTTEVATQDMHPEKRRKAAFKSFYERELSELKEEKPGLKLSQYKDMIFKRWLKSPENPMNQQNLN